MPRRSREKVAVARALVSAASAAASTGLNPYLRRHLSGHVGEVDAWPLLAEEDEVLDLLIADAVVADATRTAFGTGQLPAEVAAVLSTRHLIAAASAEQRRAVRQAAMAWSRAAPRGSGVGAASWSIVWAQLQPRSVHVVLTGHTNWVTSVATVPLPDGRTLLATGSNDRTVRLWDPNTASPVAEPLTGHTNWVSAVVAVPLPDGRTLLATSSYDGTVRLWDPSTASPVGDPLTGHTSAVRAVAAVHLPDGRTLLATSSNDRTVRLRDPSTGRPVGNPLTGHTDAVSAMAAVPLPDGRTLLATTGFRDRTVRLWDPSTGRPVGDPLTGHTNAVSAMAAVPLPDGHTLLATGSDDGTVRLWDPTTARQVGDPWSVPAFLDSDLGRDLVDVSVS
jgi:WD40 repeat protein